MWKTRIYNLVEHHENPSRSGKLFGTFIISLIILNIAAVALETVHEVQDQFGHWLHYFDLFSVFVFSLEYLMRLYVSDKTHPASNRLKSGLKFMFSTSGLIDLVAILPFYLPFLIEFDTRFVRIVRLTRFLRILKIGRYNKSLSLIWDVVRERKTELAITGFVTLIILMTASFLMYYIEGEKQPDKFPNILACFWWAIATLTTVGYGDVYPITASGKIVSGIIAIIGIGLVALPTGIVSAGFMDKIARLKREEESKEKNENTEKPKKPLKYCPHCGERLPD